MVNIKNTEHIDLSCLKYISTQGDNSYGIGLYSFPRPLAAFINRISEKKQSRLF